MIWVIAFISALFLSISSAECRGNFLYGSSSAQACETKFLTLASGGTVDADQVLKQCLRGARVSDLKEVAIWAYYNARYRALARRIGEPAFRILLESCIDQIGLSQENTALHQLMDLSSKIHCGASTHLCMTIAANKLSKQFGVFEDFISVELENYRQPLTTEQITFLSTFSNRFYSSWQKILRDRNLHDEPLYGTFTFVISANKQLKVSKSSIVKSKRAQFLTSDVVGAAPNNLACPFYEKLSTFSVNVAHVPGGVTRRSFVGKAEHLK